MLRESRHSDIPAPVEDGRQPRSSAQRGACGVTVMPRDRVVVTVGSTFMVLTEVQAWDLLAALNEVHVRIIGGAR